MADTHLISGKAAPLDIANLDTDQIMPKQFLRGIDKKGLDEGVLWDLRFDGDGQVRPEFVLNKPGYADANILITGPNFGCGSSREHAVWGLQQYGIKAVIASGFGEIFYSNAMNNGLAVVMLPQDAVAELLKDASNEDVPLQVEIDVDSLVVNTGKVSLPFTMSDRHRKMFLDGVDMIGASLAYENKIAEFAKAHWARQPWVKDVAARTILRLRQH
ncbi:MAG: 3-isopropylmalate dehydratase small subunit [Gammaproteobacteria bacterium]|nr:MAG: 3-isopropylmalate dehydratase small subunit [Gammaproteobacteria bacterium]